MQNNKKFPKNKK